MTRDAERRETMKLANRVFAAISTGDVDAVSAMWADDIEVWHNTDGISQTKDENLAVLAWMGKHTTSIEYRDVVRHVVGAGFVQHHVLHLGFADGRTVEIPAAIFAGVSNGRVARIDEYLDSAQVASAFAPLAP